MLATTSEIFPGSLAGKESKELGLVAEYLSFFLGPLDALRDHVLSASLTHLKRARENSINVLKGKAFPLLQDSATPH